MLKTVEVQFTYVYTVDTDDVAVSNAEARAFAVEDAREAISHEDFEPSRVTLTTE